MRPRQERRLSMAPQSSGITAPEEGTNATSASSVPNKSLTKSSIPLNAERMQTMAAATAAITVTEMPEMRCTSVPDRRLTMYRKASRTGSFMKIQVWSAR